MIYELILSKSEDKANAQMVWLWETYGPGLSPGGVAAYLGISRQGVHNAIKRDLLDVIKVAYADGEKIATLIPMRSVVRYRELRDNEHGQAPMNSGRNIPLKPKPLHASYTSAA